MLLVDKGRNLSKGITIDITKNNHQLFHYSFKGTSPDNDEWIKRKMNVVNRFHKSSLYIGIKLKNLNKAIEEKYLFISLEYAPIRRFFSFNYKKYWCGWNHNCIRPKPRGRSSSSSQYY